MSINNSFEIEGRLVRDPYVAILKNGDKKYLFTIATDRIGAKKHGAKQTVDFLPCEYYAAKEKYNALATLAKGSRVEVTGTIRSSRYKKDGKDVFKTSLNVNQVAYLSPKKG